MIDSSAAFQAALANDSRLFRARFLLSGEVAQGEIRKLGIHKGSCGSSEFSPGVVYCPYIEATVDNCGSVEGQELKLQIGIMTGGTLDNPTLDYIDIGYFTVGKPAVNQYQTTFTAQGRIASRCLGMLTAPGNPTLASLAAAIETDSGVTVEFDPDIDQTVPIGGSLANISDREALAVLAAVSGGYVTETSDGKIRVCKFSAAISSGCDSSILRQLPELGEQDIEITGVEVVVREADGSDPAIVYTDGDPVVLRISNTYMTEDAFPAFAQNLVGFTYRAGSLQIALGDPRLEPWDVVQFTNMASNTCAIPCMELIHTFDGGLQTEIKAPDLPDETQAPSQIEKAVKTAVAAGNAAAYARAAADAAQSAAAAASSSAASAASAAATADAKATAAGEAAATADSKAVAAGTSAAAAQASADDALSSAEHASLSANNALSQLSIVEDVVGMLNWIALHGTYAVTEDTEVDSGKMYFSRSGSGTSADPYTYSVVTDPTGDPHALGYYELSSIDEAVSNFVSTHLVVTPQGLFLQTDGVGSKVLLSSSEGVVLYGPSGQVMAKYGSTTQIGDEAGFHVEISGTELGFYERSTKVAYINNNTLHITQSVVLSEMQIGEKKWSWRINPEDDSISLKWIG